MPHSCKNISIIFPTTNGFDSLEKTIRSFETTCQEPNKVEIIIKIDPHDDTHKYNRILNSSLFSYKIVQYDRLGQYNDVHLFNSDCAKISTGELIWTLGDDLSISGNWLYYALLTRNIFPDNIYVLYFNEHRIKNGKTRSKLGISFPLISRELYKRLGFIGFNRHIERFYKEISYRIDRQLVCKEAVISHARDKVHGQRNANPKTNTSNLKTPEDWAKHLYSGSHFTVMSNDESFAFIEEKFQDISTSEIKLPDCITRSKYR